MNEWNNEGRISEEEKENLREKLNDIQENLKEQLEDIKEEIDEKSQELKEEREEMKQELEDALEDLKDEEEELRSENVEIEEALKNINDLRKEQYEEFQRKFDKHKEKVSKEGHKFTEKAKKKMEKAEKKAARRINISVEPDISEDWKDWAGDLGTSVSELVRKSMEFVKDNIGDLKKLEKMGEYFDKMGGDIERTIKESGIENLGEKIKAKITVDTNSHFRNNKETIKKRIQGIIKLHKAIPLDKLALAMNKKVEDAEKLIYELVGEGLDGTLEEGIFKYTGDIKDVIARFDKIIDEM
jgi:chromosome segregation ATPase